MLHGALFSGHRVMTHDLALEHPHLDAASVVGGLGRTFAVIDFGAERMKRHATFAIPFHARNFSTAQTTRAVDTNAERTETHRRLNGALHGATERNATLELLSDVVSNELRIDFRLADLDDVQ